MAVVAARSNFVHGATAVRVREFDPELKQVAVDELLDLMAYTSLMRKRLGQKRRGMTKTAITGLRLESQVHTDAKRLADKFEMNLGTIRKRFEKIGTKAIDKSADDIRDIMNRALEKATIGGRPTPDATDDVIDALRKNGIAPRTSRYVETLVRTHSAVAYGAAHKLSFTDDVDLWGWEYVTVGDNRVRPEHEILDGIMRKKDDDFWTTFWPPNGWNCRCQAIAVYDEEARQTPVPEDAEPDEGFDFDPADLILGEE